MPARWLALIGAVLGFLVAIPLCTGFDAPHAAMQFEEIAPWIPRFNMNYHLGIDGISLLLILLNSFMTVLVVIAGWEVIRDARRAVHGRVPDHVGLMNGVFARSTRLFYVFFEATLIPMFIIIGVWGGPNRVYAAVKFFLYTLLGSLLTLVALIYLCIARPAAASRSSTGTSCRCRWTAQVLIFLAFFAAFAVKVPMWPVHTGCRTRTSRRRPAARWCWRRSC